METLIYMKIVILDFFKMKYLIYKNYFQGFQFLAQFIKLPESKDINYYEMLNQMLIPEHPDQDFLKFISEQNRYKNFKNLKILFELEKEKPGIFAKVMSDFQKAKSYRKTLNEKGVTKRVSWKEALEKFDSENEYSGITEENKDIAKLFKELGLKQDVFTITSDLIKKQNKRIYLKIF